MIFPEANWALSATILSSIVCDFIISLLRVKDGTVQLFKTDSEPGFANLMRLLCLYGADFQQPFHNTISPAPKVVHNNTFLL